MFRTALVLSGGAARALAHLGVLEQLEKHRIRIDIIVGTSMGAIIGGLYAYYGRALFVNRHIRKFLESEIFQKGIALASDHSTTGEESEGFFQRFLTSFRKGLFYTRSITRHSLVPSDYYNEAIVQLIPEISIEQLNVPFAAVALDITSGEEIVFRTGSLRKAVMASAAIPGIFPPLNMDDRVLVDGGWVDNAPVIPAIMMGAHFVICSDSSWSISELWPNPASAIELAFRCNDITRILLTDLKKQHADVIIRPRLHGITWSDFGSIDHCYLAGSIACKEMIPEIKKKRRFRYVTTLGGLLTPPGRKPLFKISKLATIKKQK